MIKETHIDITPAVDINLYCNHIITELRLHINDKWQNNRNSVPNILKGHTHIERQFNVTKGNHRNVTKVLVLCLQLLIRLFSVKRVASYCRISQIPVLVFFFQSVLLQPLEAALVRTNNKCILGFALDNLQFVRTKASSNGCKKTLWQKNVYNIYY